MKTMIRKLLLTLCLLAASAYAATITGVETLLQESNGTTLVVLWEAMGNDDVGTPVQRNQFADRSVQVTGTFGGATVTIEGSNDGTNYVTLTDYQGTDVAFTTAGQVGIAEITRYIRPQTAGGSGTDVDVTLFARQ